MRDGQTNEQLKIELLSQWKLEAEFRNLKCHKFECHESYLHLLKGLCSRTELGSRGGEVEKEEKEEREKAMLWWAASNLRRGQGEQGIKPPHDRSPTYHTLKPKKLKVEEADIRAFLANDLGKERKKSAMRKKKI